MYLYRILQRKSDREHRLTVSDMIEELAEYGIKAERKSVYSDIAILREMGYHIVMHRSREVSYYLEPSPLSVDDLKLLTALVVALFLAVPYWKAIVLPKKKEV